MDKLITHYRYDGQTSRASVNLTGSFCTHEAIRFRDRITEFIKNTSPDLTIDLTNVNSFDLTGLNCLIRINQYMYDHHYRLMLVVDKDSPVVNVLNETKMERILPIRYKRVYRA